ncbi:ABC transporter substrate-binding protein [Nakamurella sp. YIM 132087]|uniref:ABC transporter substrate-binding protein n=1 Tax=Nakamurella alba TaxID=2665158 RepID=A0A7K1FL82_9ACTN|nr:iron-siderophore ABC transporter substrate-binding protein [Nakamurella alba]MTD14901.1 ABC transporter substrate-binding protein [Nakamurella alba]
MTARWRLWCAAVLGAAVLTGCGSSPTGESSVLNTSALNATAQATGSGTAEAPAADGTRTVTDALGEQITVPADPQRVVTLSEPTLDGVLALGITPAGTTAGRGRSTVADYLPASAQQIPLLGTVAQPNVEAIAAATPDLILVDGTSINNNPPLIETLQEIAPTVQTGLAGGDWEANFSLVAQALGKESDGDRVLADYHSRADELAGGLSSHAEQTFSIVRWQGNSASLILKELPAGRALTDLGLQRPGNQDRNGRGHSEPVALENLAEIDADWIFFGTLGGSSVGNPQAGGGADSAAAQAVLEEAARTPGFTTLQAYRAGQVVPVDGSVWTSTGGPLLMSRILDDVSAALLGT